MASVTVEREINAPRDDVWAVLTDLDQVAATIRGIQSIEKHTDGPMGVGTKWTETRKMMGKSATETMWVTTFNPPQVYVVEAGSHGTHYRTTISVEPRPGKTTLVKYVFEGRPMTLMTKLMSPMFFPFQGHGRQVLPGRPGRHCREG